MASGASTHVSRSSLPVLTKVPTEVRIRKKSDARKKRSAGSAGSLAGSVAEAMMRKFMVAPAEVNSREGKSTAVQKITRQARAESAEGDASEARAALRVRLEMASDDGEVISASEIVLAFGMRGSCATVTRNGRSVMARYVTAWRAVGRASSCSDCFAVIAGKSSLRCSFNSAMGSVRTAMVGKCHSFETNTEIWSGAGIALLADLEGRARLCIAACCDGFGGGRSKVRPRESRRTAAASVIVSDARFFRRAG